MKRTRGFWFSLFLIGSISPTTLCAQDLAIVGAKIVEHGRTVEAATVVVRGGRIEQIGTDIQVPAGMKTVDGKGLLLYPGFIDGYATTGIKMPDAPAAATRPSATAGAPSAMWDKNRAGIRSRVNAAEHLDLATTATDANAAGFTSGLVAPFSGLARGHCAWVPFIPDGKGPAVPVGMTFSFRGGGGGGGYPGTTMASYALLRQTMYDARNPRLVGEGEKIDPDLAALRPGSVANGQAVFALDTDGDLHRARGFCEEFGLKLVVAGGRDAFRRADWFAETKTPVIVSIAFGTEPSIEESASGPPKAVLEERRAAWQERSKNLAELEKAGARFALSSDGDSYSDFLSNLRRAVQFGLSKPGALKALTQTPAEILGVWSQAGSIEVGKRADFVLTKGDLFETGSIVVDAYIGGVPAALKKGASN